MITQNTVSVALYYTPTKGSITSLEWFDRVRSFFEGHKLLITNYFVQGGQFTLDDCVNFEERGAELITALRRAEVSSVGLYSRRHALGSLEDWRAFASAAPSIGMLYFGIDDEVVELHDLFREALRVADDLYDVRYGISYKLPLAKRPASYATGMIPTTGAKVREVYEAHAKAIRESHPNQIWTQELLRSRRYLTGLFGGVFPANILSDAHLNTVDVGALRVGKLIQLRPSLWLWELSDSEMPEAERILKERNVLITGVGQW
jgi:hypothetical protein